MTQPLLRDVPAPARVDDASTVMVEGRTAEEALEKVHRDVGEDARILQAEKVRRGGVGGFFAREMVQLTVAAEQDEATARGLGEPLFLRDVDPPAVAPAAPVAPAEEPAPPSDPVLRMAAAADADEITFGEALRSALGTSTELQPPADPGAAATTVEPATPVTPSSGALPEVVATPPTLGDGTVGPAAPRRAHWATAAGRAGMRSLAVGAEALAAARVEPTAPEVVARATTPTTIDLDALTAGTPMTVVPTATAPTVPSIPAPPAPAAPEPVAAARPTPAPPPPPPAAAATPRWSRDRLLRVGLSDALADDVVAAGPTDDVAWLHALARAVEPLLRPGPAGACVYVGGRIERHAKGAAATLCRPSDTTVPAGSLALARRPGEAVRDWLDTVADGRWLHLVVGGEGWREWLWEVPAAVSWAAPEDLPVALGVARSFDLPLVGTVGVDGPVTATAVDIAMAIRTMLERP